MELEIGDVVQLKSGSPLMTVESIGENNYVRAIWYVDGTVKEHAFPTAALQKIDPAKESC